MNEKQRFPEPNGEVPGGNREAFGGASEVPGGQWLTVAEVAELLTISERSARDWVKRHALPTNDARPLRVQESAVRVQIAREHRSVQSIPEPSGEATGGSSEAHGESTEPIEAAYRVTPAAIEQAVSRTSAQYMGDLRTMLAEIGKVYEGQLAAKDAALEAKDQALAIQTVALGAKDETIAELRRRAEAVETERAAVLQRAEDAAREARAEDAGILRRLRALQEENMELRRQAVLAELVVRSAPVPPGPRAPAPHHDGPLTSGRVAHAGPAQAAQEAPGAPGASAEVREGAPGVWGQLRRWYGRRA